MSLILNGAALDLPVRDFLQYPDIVLHDGHGARPRHEAITQVVVHTTGGEGEVGQFRNTLERRGVGADFFVDRWGDIWQLSDPARLATFHGGKHVNPRAVGIEVACYLFRWPARARWSLTEAPPNAADREVYEARVAGVRYYFAGLYPAQTHAVTRLVEALVEALPDVERAVPREADGSLRTRRFSIPEVQAYSGVLGHLHIPGSTKLDPGTQVLEVLRRRFHG